MISDKGRRVAARSEGEGRMMENLTPCRICRKQGEKEKVLLIGFYQEAWTHGASIMAGGFPAGQVARPVAVVLLESGEIETVLAEDVTIDVGGLFEQYAWMDGDWR